MVRPTADAAAAAGADGKQDGRSKEPTTMEAAASSSAAGPVRLDVALQAEKGKSTAACRRRGRFVARDLDDDDDKEESVSLPDFSKLSISSRPTDPSAVSAGTSSSTQDGPVASRTRAKEKDRQVFNRSGRGLSGGRGWVSGRAAAGASSPSPTLSRYGVALDYEAPPEQEVLAHALHLTGFPKEHEGTQEQRREELVKPWTGVGALIRWLPGDQGAVATFCSIPTAQRAARKLPSGPGGVRAAPLHSCTPEIQQRALAAGLVIPARPKADTAAPSRLIMGALGIRSPSSTRPPIGKAQSQRTPVTRSQAAKSTPAEGDANEKERGPAAAADRGPPPPARPPPRRGGGSGSADA